MKETIGEYIHKLRTSKGLTLTKLGAALGIDSGALSKIENGKKTLDPKCLALLANEFSLDLQTLKEEYFAEKIAFELLNYTCTENTLKIAEEKLKYLKEKKTVQTKLNL